MRVSVVGPEASEQVQAEEEREAPETLEVVEEEEQQQDQILWTAQTARRLLPLPEIIPTTLDGDWEL